MQSILSSVGNVSADLAVAPNSQIYVGTAPTPDAYIVPNSNGFTGYTLYSSSGMRAIMAKWD